MGVTRLARLVLLLEDLETYIQPYGDPKTSKYPGEGAGPERKQTCERCLGVKKLLGNGPCMHCRDKTGKRHKCEKCKKCAGRGSYWVNSFVGQVEGAPEHKAYPGPPRRKRKGMGRQDLGDVIHRVDAQRVLRNARGSYEDVERALAKLKVTDEIACYLVKAQYIEKRWSVAPSAATAYAVTRGLLGLLDLLEDSRLQVPARLLVQDSVEGARTTAKKIGLSRNQVRRARAV